MAVGAATLGVKLWETSVGGGIPGGSTPAIGSDGTIYTTSSERLYSIDPSGKTNWTFRTLGAAQSGPSVAPDGTINFASPSSFKVYAVGADGIEKWNFVTPKPVLVTPTYGQDGTVYFGDSAGTFYALQPDGRLRWTFQLSTNTSASASYQFNGMAVIGADQTVYVSSGRYLYALSPSGVERWRSQLYTDGAGDDTTPSIASSGTIYAGGMFSGRFSAISPDGQEIWQGGSGPADEFIIGLDGLVFPDSARLGYNTTAFDANGTRVNYDGLSQVFAALSDGTYLGLVRSGNFERSLVIFRPVGGGNYEVEWTYRLPPYTGGDLPHPLPAKPTVGADGTIYVTTEAGKLLALQGQAPLANSSWPTFLGNVRHSGQVPNALPGLVIQPRDVLAIANSPVVMSALGSGTGPISYQWERNGVALPGATNSILRFPSVLLSDAGRYRLQVNNPLGTATSQEVSLTVNPAVRLELFAGLTIDGEAGQNCLIEFTTNLEGVGGWGTLTNFALPSSHYLWVDQQSANQLRRFYRTTLSP